MRKRTTILTALCILFLASTAFSQAARRVYEQAKAAESGGNRDMALLYYRQILRDHPDSDYAEDAHFFLGKYYYESRNYFQASRTFNDFLKKYPRSGHRNKAKEYLNRMQMGSLKERADRLFEQGKLDAASALYQQYLEIDPNNEEVKAQIELIKKTQKEMQFGFEQLARERKKFEQDKEAFQKELAQLETSRKEAESLHKQAMEMNTVTVEKYEKRLEAASSQMEALNTRIASLETELQGWRQRAVLAEATKLSQPLGGRLSPLPQGEQLPHIAFGGGKADPSPAEGEVQITDSLREGFPSVVITEEKLDIKKNLRNVEAVVSLDLSSPWPEGAKMKFRVDIVAEKGQPAPSQPLLVRYFDVSDMDEIEESINSYRKRLVFTAQEKLTERYEVSAFLVQTQ